MFKGFCFVDENLYLFDLNEVKFFKNELPRPLFMNSDRVGQSKLLLPRSKLVFLYPNSSYFDLI